MERRLYLKQAAALGGIFPLAGCQFDAGEFRRSVQGNGEGEGGEESSDSENGSNDDEGEGPTSSGHTAGEFVEHDQIAVTVNELLAAGEYKLDVEDSEVNPPTAGGYWMFINLEVEHVGGERRPFPDAGDVVMPYQGDALSRQFIEDEDFVVRDEVLENYHATLARENIYDRGAFPGVVVDAWLVFEVPKEYQLDEFSVEVEWGSSESTREAVEWTFKEADLTRNPDRDYDG